MTTTTPNRVPVDKATAAQLANFGMLVYGLSFDEGMKPVQIVAKLQEAGFNGETIPLIETQAPREVSPAGHKKRKNPDTGKSETLIRLHASNVPGGSSVVPVGVNGSVMLIPRDEDSWVPDDYVHALGNAKMEVYDEYSSGDGGLRGKREVLSYPFSYV